MKKTKTRTWDSILLSKDSYLRKESEGMLRYALHIDYNVPDISTNSPKLIDILKDVCAGVCAQLTNEYDLSFFGTNDRDDSTSAVYNRTILDDNIRILHKPRKELSQNQREQLRSTKIRYTCLQDIIINDSILEAFHTLLYTKLYGISYPAYSLLGIRDIYDVIQHSFESNPNSYARKNFITKRRGRASDFDGKWTNISSIPNFMQLVNPIKSNRRKIEYYPLYSSIYDRLSLVNLSHLKHVFDSSREYSRTDLDALHGIHTVLMTSEKDSNNNAFKQHNNLVDGIYHYFLSEKITNIGLFYSVIDNIKRVEERTNYRFGNKETVEILSTLSTLPNVFGRIPLVRYAFDYIDPYTRPGTDLKNKMESSASLSLGLYSPFIPIESRYKHFSFERWLTQIDYMISFLSELLIPACSWCFLLMLLQIIEDNIKDEPYDIQKIYKTAISILGAYIMNNKEVIMHPIVLQNKSQNMGLDLFTWNPGWIVSFADVDCIPLLFEEFFKAGNKGNWGIRPLSHDILICDKIETIRYLRGHNARVIYGKYLDKFK